MITLQTTPPPSFAATNSAQAQANSLKIPPRLARPWFERKNFVLLLLLVIGLAVGAAYLGGAGESGQAVQPQAKAVAAGIDTKVRDGGFEFVVTGVEHPGKSFAGKAGKTLTAKGEFVIVRVEVTNIGDVEKRLGCSCHRLFADNGRAFEPSSDILSTKDALKYVEWISPGDTVRAASLLFDVPSGTSLRNIELHENSLSKGVRVNLS